MQIRDFLPRILNGEVLGSFQRLKIAEKNLERKEQEVEQLRTDCAHFRARLEAAQADSIREKKEKLALRQQLDEARRQLLLQAEYCTDMGAAACTLLWGVSASEDVVKAMLGGEKTLKFFSITAQTMESFVKSLDGDVKEPDSAENQFVCALAGVMTNVAAIACGREFLVNSSRALLDTVLQLLGDLRPGQCTKLKVYGGWLLLMSLYNVSINLKGLKYISESPGFIPLLWWLLSGRLPAVFPFLPARRGLPRGGTAVMCVEAPGAPAVWTTVPWGSRPPPVVAPRLSCGSRQSAATPPTLLPDTRGVLSSSEGVQRTGTRATAGFGLLQGDAQAPRSVGKAGTAAPRRARRVPMRTRPCVSVSSDLCLRPSAGGQPRGVDARQHLKNTKR
ncbi:heat shock factor 2-binding protein isoform X3 [Lutra lutra]|nr:heat shock factor 2-binding protein isoform X3 [Lutra lutra]XP_047574966.1 heat shock factor 2-binding protein isoform X3 [Lutra lutra]XP_047574976.1 heat shock factor 2-binding protein isoform X3 [Lutra lutra]